MSASLKAEIEHQHRALSRALRLLLAPVARACSNAWHSPQALDAMLATSLPQLPGCRLLYALDCHGRQVSANVSTAGIDQRARGQEEWANRMILSETGRNGKDGSGQEQL